MEILYDSKLIDKCTLLKEYLDVPMFYSLCKKCPNFGRYYSCPPYDFQTEELLSPFEGAMVMGAKIMIPEHDIKTIFEKDAMNNYSLSVIHQARKPLEEKLLSLEKIYPGSKAFYAGSCLLCKDCKRDSGESCEHPEQMRYSLESIGFDVGKLTSQLLGFPLCWTTDKLPPYFTLVTALFLPHLKKYEERPLF